MSAAEVLETDPPVHELIARRRSPRAFDSDRAVSREAILSLLEAARLAPSSFNEQPWRFLIFDGGNRSRLEQARSCLAEGNAWARSAPMLLLSVAGVGKSVGDEKTHGLNGPEREK